MVMDVLVTECLQKIDREQADPEWYSNATVCTWKLLSDLLTENTHPMYPLYSAIAEYSPSMLPEEITVETNCTYEWITGVPDASYVYGTRTEKIMKLYSEHCDCAHSYSSVNPTVDAVPAGFDRAEFRVLNMRVKWQSAVLCDVKLITDVDALIVSKPESTKHCEARIQKLAEDTRSWRREKHGETE